MKTDLVEIFQTIRANVQPYSTNGFAARINSEDTYEIWSEKALDVNGNALEPSLFASIKIEENSVLFDLIPIEKDPELKKLIHEDLVKLLKEKSRFVITQLDEALTGHITDALVVGYTSYKQKGWV